MKFCDYYVSVTDALNDCLVLGKEININAILHLHIHSPIWKFSLKNSPPTFPPLILAEECESLVTLVFASLVF